MEDLKKLPQNNVYDSTLVIMVEIELSLKYNKQKAPHYIYKWKININITVLLNDLNVSWVFCLVCKSKGLITNSDHDVEH